MSSGRHGEGEVLTDRLVQRLQHVEPSTRVALALQLLEILTPEVIVEILRILLLRREDGDAAATGALAPVLEALSELGEGETASAIYAAAREAGLDGVSRILMRPAPEREFRPAEELGVDREMRDLSVGYRRQLARTASYEQMIRLSTDPDPGVIRNLLNHPRLDEARVVTMASRRPARPEVLREIYRSSRWKARKRIRRALANNPFTPTEIGLKLVSLLALPDVRELASDKNLHEEVRRAARARLVDARHRREVSEAAANLEDLDPAGDA